MTRQQVIFIYNTQGISFKSLFQVEGVFKRKDTVQKKTLEKNISSLVSCLLLTQSYAQAYEMPGAEISGGLAVAELKHGFNPKFENLKKFPVRPQFKQIDELLKCGNGVPCYKLKKVLADLKSSEVPIFKDIDPNNENDLEAAELTLKLIRAGDNQEDQASLFANSARQEVMDLKNRVVVDGRFINEWINDPLSVAESSEFEVSSNAIKRIRLMKSLEIDPLIDLESMVKSSRSQIALSANSKYEDLIIHNDTPSYISLSPTETNSKYEDLIIYNGTSSAGSPKIQDYATGLSQEQLDKLGEDQNIVGIALTAVVIIGVAVRLADEGPPMDHKIIDMNEASKL